MYIFLPYLCVLFFALLNFHLIPDTPMCRNVGHVSVVKGVGILSRA